MTDADRPQFARVLAVLSQAFNESVSEQRAEAYWIALRDLDLDLFEAAAFEAMKTLEWFPKPVQLRELLDGAREDDIEHAWLEYKTLARRFGGYASPEMDAALLEALTLVFGSWQAACWSDFSDEMWASKRKEFGRTYRVLRNRGLRGTVRAVGFIEQDHRDKGLLSEGPKNLPAKKDSDE